MAATITRFKNILWQNENGENKVPYTTENFPYPGLVKDAIDNWWAKTRLNFLELNRSNIDSVESYLVFRYETDPNSQSHTCLGHIRGKKIHEVVVNKNNKDILRALLHEIGHSLGLLHEHQRNRRDFFIRVNKDNWDKHRWPLEAFEQNVKNVYPSSLECTGISNQPNKFEYYDFESIMHYHQYSFGDGNHPTIEIKDRHNADLFRDKMGTEAKLTNSDIVGVKNMYGI